MNSVECEKLGIVVMKAKPDIPVRDAARLACKDGGDVDLIEACLIESMLETECGLVDYRKALAEFQKASIAEEKGAPYAMDGHPVDASVAKDTIGNWLLVKLHQKAGI